MHGVEAGHRFFVDAMLGSLARWLRTIGYDVRYEKDIGDSELVRKALLEGRVVVTKDKLLALRRALKGRCVLIKGAGLEQELREFTALFKAPQGVFLSRCIRCNEALIKIPKEDASGLVPVYVYETQEGFSKCPSCRRVYWTGTHRREMLKELKKLLGGDYEG